MGRVIRESIGLIGFWMTLRYLLIYLLSYKPFNDGSFDRRHGTDTGGMVPTVDLAVRLVDCCLLLLLLSQDVGCSLFPILND